MRARIGAVRDFLDRHTAWLIAAGLLALFGLGVQVLRQSNEISGEQTQLRALVASTTHNRVVNVATWCGAIDKLDRTLIAYVEQFGQEGVPAFVAPPLDCAAIEKRTAQSNH